MAAQGDPSASHNCFAWVIGSEVRAGDDGEPSGTAGAPILSAIQAEHLDHVCVLVTRYLCCFQTQSMLSQGLSRYRGKVPGSMMPCILSRQNAVMLIGLPEEAPCTSTIGGTFAGPLFLCSRGASALRQPCRRAILTQHHHGDLAAMMYRMNHPTICAYQLEAYFER